MFENKRLNNDDDDDMHQIGIRENTIVDLIRSTQQSNQAKAGNAVAIRAIITTI